MFSHLRLFTPLTCHLVFLQTIPWSYRCSCATHFHINEAAPSLCWWLCNNASFCHCIPGHRLPDIRPSVIAEARDTGWIPTIRSPIGSFRFPGDHRQHDSIQQSCSCIKKHPIAPLWNLRLSAFPYNIICRIVLLCGYTIRHIISCVNIEKP